MTMDSFSKPSPGGKAVADRQVVRGQDHFDRLSLAAIPLAGETLRSAHLVKNAQMETMVELVNDPLSGSLQVRPDDITFAASDGDRAIIDKLSKLKSFDAYSLRASLQGLGIPVDAQALELSPEMKEKLHQYTLDFTRPLIRNIFGGGELEGESLQKILRDSDRGQVAARLKIMAEKTGIPVAEIPGFLGNYGDLFLSGAYYRHSFEALQPEIARLEAWLAALKAERATANPQAQQALLKSEQALIFLCGSVQERLAQYRGGFEVFWSNMSQKTFVRLKRQIEANQAGMGALLCGLTVKQRDWSTNFADNNAGSPPARMKYVTAALLPGLERLRAMESEARLLGSSG